MNYLNNMTGTDFMSGTVAIIRGVFHLRQRECMPDPELGEPHPYVPMGVTHDEETWYHYDPLARYELIEVVIHGGPQSPQMQQN
jgi:hypothetical protein